MRARKERESRRRQTDREVERETVGERQRERERRRRESADLRTTEDESHSLQMGFSPALLSSVCSFVPLSVQPFLSLTQGAAKVVCVCACVWVFVIADL